MKNCSNEVSPCYSKIIPHAKFLRPEFLLLFLDKEDKYSKEDRHDINLHSHYAHLYNKLESYSTISGLEVTTKCYSKHSNQ